MHELEPAINLALPRFCGKDMHFLYSADVLEEDVYRKLKCINFRMNFPRLIPAGNQQQESDIEFCSSILATIVEYQ